MTFTVRGLALLLFLLLAPFQGVLQAQEVQYTVRITPVQGQPFVVKAFRANGRDGFDATWRGGAVRLTFAELEAISLSHEGNVRRLQADVRFRDGRKDTFEFQPFNLTGESAFGKWSMSWAQVRQIEFQRGEGFAGEATSDFDQVQMKNGDVISGRIVTEQFTLRTSYGTHIFAARQIQVINLEGGGQNIDLLILRIGDRLSGVVENATVRIAMRSGTEVELSRDKIKDIVFKK